MSKSTSLFAAATDMFEAAAIESRIEGLRSESRVARLKAVAELERAGRMEEAQDLLDEVKREQKADRRTA
jgi:hypothetical protein